MEGYLFGNDNGPPAVPAAMFQFQVFHMDMIARFGQLPRLAFAAAAVLGGAVAAWAQDQPAAPLYAAAQAERGQAAYSQNCQECHGSTLDNGEFGGPPLKGGYFRNHWGQGSVADLTGYAKAWPCRRIVRAGSSADLYRSRRLPAEQQRLCPRPTELPSDPRAAKDELEDRASRKVEAVFGRDHARTEQLDFDPTT